MTAELVLCQEGNAHYFGAMGRSPCLTLPPCNQQNKQKALPHPGFCVGYKGGKIYWLAIHSNQANLIVGGLRHRRHQQTRQALLFGGLRLIRADR
jgi:hypothetical protein